MDDRRLTMDDRRPTTDDRRWTMDNRYITACPSAGTVVDGALHPLRERRLTVVSAALLRTMPY